MSYGTKHTHTHTHTSHIKKEDKKNKNKNYNSKNVKVVQRVDLIRLERITSCVYGVNLYLHYSYCVYSV